MTQNVNIIWPDWRRRKPLAILNDVADTRRIFSALESTRMFREIWTTLAASRHRNLMVCDVVAKPKRCKLAFT